MFAESLYHNHTLRVLDLMHNGIYQQGVQALHSALSTPSSDGLVCLDSTRAPPPHSLTLTRRILTRRWWGWSWSSWAFLMTS